MSAPTPECQIAEALIDVGLRTQLGQAYWNGFLIGAGLPKGGGSLSVTGATYAPAPVPAPNGGAPREGPNEFEPSHDAEPEPTPAPPHEPEPAAPEPWGPGPGDDVPIDRAVPPPEYRAVEERDALRRRFGQLPPRPPGLTTEEIRRAIAQQGDDVPIDRTSGIGYQAGFRQARPR